MGIRVVTNPRGYLRFRIFWKRRDIVVGTKYRDDGPSGRNTKLVKAKAILIEERLRDGRELHHALLEVLGDCPPHLMPRKPAPRMVTVRDHYKGWIKRVQPPLVRASSWKRHRHCFEAIILPRLGSSLLSEIGTAEMEDLRAELLAGKTARGTRRTIKAVRNIIDWHLRSFWRDARRHGLVGAFPHLEWPRVRKAKPDPFEPSERDRIIAWFERESPAFAPWVKFLFWTGVRPGEGAALRLVRRGSAPRGDHRLPQPGRARGERAEDGWFEPGDSDAAGCGRGDPRPSPSAPHFGRRVRLPDAGTEADDRYVVAQAGGSSPPEDGRGARSLVPLPHPLSGSPRGRPIGRDTRSWRGRAARERISRRSRSTAERPSR